MISKDMSLLELMQVYPETKEFLESHGMACVRCMGAADETIENASKQHGIDLEQLLNDLNRLLNFAE